MNILEIAKYIVNKYPDCCMAYNYNKSSLEEMSKYAEDLLIEECLDFFNHEKVKICGCGVPEDTYEVIRKLLTIRKEKADGEIDYHAAEKRYENDLSIDMSDSGNYGLWQFMMYMLDECGMLEHGSSIGSAWITEEGRMYLEVLNMKKRLDEEAE